MWCRGDTGSAGIDDGCSRTLGKAPLEHRRSRWRRYRAELSWQAEAGTAAKLASALRGWQKLRFEVTEEPSNGVEGERYSFTPALGVFHATTGVHGDIMVPEERLKAAMLKAASGEADLTEEVERLLGRPWDDELEPFRYAGDGAPVRWLHQVV